MLKTAYEEGNKLLIVGNGGSVADAKHITGELMEFFLRKRVEEKRFENALADIYGDEGAVFAGKLEGVEGVLPL